MLQLPMWYLLNVYMCEKVHARAYMQYWREFAKCRFTHFPSFFSVHVDTYDIIVIARQRGRVHSLQPSSAHSNLYSDSLFGRFHNVLVDSNYSHFLCT